MFGLRKDPKKEFWRWLVSHRREIHDEINCRVAPVGQHWSISELGRRLAVVDANLVHEIDMADPATVELIISAGGIKETFPSVIELVKSAPVLNGIRITAFKPRWGDGFQLQIAGQSITGELLTYRLISEGDTLGIELFIDCELDKKTRSMVGFLSLDQRLGEYDFATGLKWIEFAGGRPTEALPITGLAQDFDSRRAVLTH